MQFGVKKPIYETKLQFCVTSAKQVVYKVVRGVGQSNSFIIVVLMFENRFNHDKSENNVLCSILILHAFVSGCLDFEQSFS